MRIAATPRSSEPPRRLVRPRSRKADRRAPTGALYVGRPTKWGNPFEGRPGVSHARSVILYRAWMAGEATRTILHALRFGEDEITGLFRWRHHLIERLHELAGKHLQCWCPLTSDWCHADVLLALANPSRRLAA